MDTRKISASLLAFRQVGCGCERQEICYVERSEAKSPVSVGVMLLEINGQGYK